jgi:hypothetical protein
MPVNQNFSLRIKGVIRMIVIGTDRITRINFKPSWLSE